MKKFPENVFQIKIFPYICIVKREPLHTDGEQAVPFTTNLAVGIKLQPADRPICHKLMAGNKVWLISRPAGVKTPLLQAPKPRTAGPSDWTINTDSPPPISHPSNKPPDLSREAETKSPLRHCAAHPTVTPTGLRIFNNRWAVGPPITECKPNYPAAIDPLPFTIKTINQHNKQDHKQDRSP